MESRNISLTTCGERLDHSPRDRKAVSDIYDLFQPAVAATAVCYPLYNLIPEIISDENLERSFKRVMAEVDSIIIVICFIYGFLQPDSAMGEIFVMFYIFEF